MSILHGNFKREIRLSFNPELEEQAEKEENERRKISAQPEINVEIPLEPTPEYVENLAEDERLDYLLRAKHNLTEYYENMAYVPPHGLPAHDYKSIAASRQEGLEKLKMQTRRENYIYLSQHPEIDAMIEIVLKKLMNNRPADPIKYMAEYFCVKQTSMEEHKKQIREERARIARHRKAKSKEFDLPSQDVSASIRKLNLGPFADVLQFSNTKEPTPEKSPEEEPKESSETEKPPEEKAPGPQKYCGCKDWKKNRNRKHLLREDSEKKWSVPDEPFRVTLTELEIWEQLEAEASQKGVNDEYDSNEDSDVSEVLSDIRSMFGSLPGTAPPPPTQGLVRTSLEEEPPDSKRASQNKGKE